MTVVKVGTTAVAPGAEFEADVAGDIVKKIEQSREADPRHNVVMVCSGGIALGMKRLGVAEFPEDVESRQLCSLAGSYELGWQWQQVSDRPVTLHLITHDMFDDPARLEDFHTGIRNSLKAGCLPIVNENDAVSTEEIKRRFGDNDELSAILAVDLKADRIIMLSQQAGLFDKNPQLYADATLISEVSFASEVPAIMEGKSTLGRGGMSDKRTAISVATGNGIPVCLTSPQQFTGLAIGEPFPGTVFQVAK